MPNIEDQKIKEEIQACQNYWYNDNYDQNDEYDLVADYESLEFSY